MVALVSSRIGSVSHRLLRKGTLFQAVPVDCTDSKIELGHVDTPAQVSPNVCDRSVIKHDEYIYMFIIVHQRVV